MIEAGRYTSSLSDDSKMKPDLGLLTYLHSAGRTQTHKWLAQNLASVGKRETVDLAERFLGGDWEKKFIQTVKKKGIERILF